MKTHREDQLTFTVSLTQPAHQLADKFCQRQSNLQKAEQVYLNTLTVYAVNYYLQCLGFRPDWEQSDSWDATMQTFLDVADLQVENYGKLECRPVLPDAAVVYLPEEFWQERIGYVVVQLDESLQEATLLGFAETASIKELSTGSIKELSLAQLRSLEDLPQYLNQLKQPQLAEGRVNLRQWLHGIFDLGWEKVEAIFAAPPELALGFRQPPGPGARRCKLITLRQQQSGVQVALCVGMTPTESSQMDICIDVYPVGGQPFLPQDLQVMVLDEQGEAVVQALARSTETIQLNFRGESGEGFGIKLVLGDVSVTEAFVI